MSTKPDRRTAGSRPRPHGQAPQRRRWRGSPLQTAGIVVGAAIVTLLVIFAVSHRGGGSAGSYQHQVGDPGPGAEAPAIRLESTTGGTFDLASMRGQSVLLYFQEGLGCQPCWDQMKDIEKHAAEFKSAGIDQVVSITTSPLDQIRQKVGIDGIATQVLSDPDLSVSRAYNANQYGMMGDSSDGHSFVLVDPEGMIRWRADYGGAPDYTMFVPANALLEDLRAGR